MAGKILSGAPQTVERSARSCRHLHELWNSAQDLVRGCTKRGIRRTILSAAPRFCGAWNTTLWDVPRGVGGKTRFLRRFPLAGSANRRFPETAGLAPNATYFVAARRKPSGLRLCEIPGGLRRTATKCHPFGVKVSGIGLPRGSDAHYEPSCGLTDLPDFFSGNSR